MESKFDTPIYQQERKKEKAEPDEIEFGLAKIQDKGD